MNDWHYDIAQDLDQPLAERLRRFPREPDMLSYGVRTVAAVTVRMWLRTYHRLRIVGLENLPVDRSFVIVANHTSHLDALCLLSAVPLRRLHQAFPAAAADYFFMTLPRVAMSAIIVNALPFHRDTHSRQSLAICRQLLASPGNILIIFPEGHRSPSGSLAEFKPGIGMLVAGSAVPVIPCHLSGAHRALAKGRLIPRPTQIELRIGKARTYADHSLEREPIRRICQDLHTAVFDLSQTQILQGEATVPAN